MATLLYCLWRGCLLKIKSQKQAKIWFLNIIQSGQGGEWSVMSLKRQNGLGICLRLPNAIAYDIKVPFTRETWHGRMKACRGIGASSLSAEEIAAWEREHKSYMKTLPETFDVLHYATVLDLQAK